MNKSSTRVILALFLTIMLSGITVRAEIPERISFQGKLMTINGQPFNGTKNMTFTIDSFTKQMNVPVINGLYSVIIDVPDSIFSGTSPVLNIKVDGMELTPDTEFNSVPYSYFSRISANAEKLDGKTSGSYLQTLSIDSNKITISNGNTIELPPAVGNDVLQDLVFGNDTLKITNNPDATKIVLDKYSQDLELIGDTLKINKIDSATLIDLRPYKQTLSLNTGRLTISDGNTVDLTFVEQDPKVGTQTTNYLPKWNGSALESSLLFSDNGRISIGTVTPSARLHTECALPIKAFAAYNNYSSGGGAEIGITIGTNADPGLKVFTQGTGSAGDFSIINSANPSTALVASSTGTGSAGKFSSTSPITTLEVTNINTNPGSSGIKASSPTTAVYGQTVAGKAIEGVATGAGNGIYGYSENSIGGLFQSGNATAFALKSDGNFLTTTSARIDGNTGMGGPWDVGYRLYVYGSAYATGFWQSSDENLKNSIKTINSPLNSIQQIRGVEYQWNAPEKFGEGRQIGFIAQELQKTYPELVKQTENGYAVQYAPLTAVLVEAVKELNSRNESLKTEIDTLKMMILQLQTRIDAISGSK